MTSASARGKRAAAAARLISMAVPPEADGRGDQDEPGDPMSQVTHVVLVSWAGGRGPAAEESIRPAVRGFSGTIPGIVHLVEGSSVSPEGLEDGLDYGFVVTFDDARARDAYLVDERHRVVADAIGNSAQRIVVFDI